MKVEFLAESMKVEILKGEKIREKAKQHKCCLAIGDSVLTDGKPAVGFYVDNGRDSAFIIASAHGIKIDNAHNEICILMNLNPQKRNWKDQKFVPVFSIGRFDDISSQKAVSMAGTLFKSLGSKGDNFDNLYKTAKRFGMYIADLELKTNRRKAGLYWPED